MAIKFTTVEGYISTFPDDVQQLLQKVRRTIHEVIPEATEVISYGIPAFSLHGRCLIYFAGWKEYLSLYPIPTVPEIVQKEIAPYVHSKGTLRFPLDQPIPYDLIKRLINYRLQEEARR